MKTFKMRKFLTLVLAAMMLVTSLPVGLLAETDYNYNDLTSDKAKIINKDKPPLKPAKLEGEQTAADLIANPAQPAIYTLRTDYKVQRGENYEVDYQPYIASVGEAATQAEKEKVKKTIKLPDLTGYEKPDDDYLITYDKVKEAADGKAKSGNDTNGIRYQANEDFKYKAKSNTITIKHVFQDLHDFTKYTNPDGSVGEKGQLITTQNGNTGSTMEVSPLDGKHPNRKGFVPEAPSIIMQVPENAEEFVLEYRYNRAHYDVNFDTKGGTPVPSRTLYYEQIIPTIDEKSIPTKAGCDFLGWMPSITLETTGEKTYPENQIIKDSNDKPILNLDADLKMPASKITFTAVWKDKPKAEYAIQFWTEKPDYDDKDNTLPLRDRYDFIGARRVDNADTGSTPDLTNLDIHGITFPDLNDGRLEKAQDDKKEFERYYFLNEDLTKKQNASEDNPEVQKTVSSTGETVYNVYYDRRVYTLYFTAANELAFDLMGSFWPIITREGQVIGKEGSPYKVDVRFNQSLDKIWPKDEEVSNLPPASSEEGVDIGLIGWTINNNADEQMYRDTPPYRLSAEDFIDAEDVMGTGEFEGFGHADQIPIGDNKIKARDKYEISIGSTSYEKTVVHHIDIIKDDFDGKEQIDYDMSYWKSDTSGVDYYFGLPHLQGFTLKEETREAKWIGKIKSGDVEKTFDELNTERNEKTPFRSDADKIEYIDKFPWGTKSFKGINAYNYANYSRNKYKLKLNNDPKKVKNDSEYGAGNILEVPYELPLNDLKLDTTHKPQKPTWVPDDWGFLGWALDPAGENLIKDGNETKLHYDQILYAKWGEPDYKWKVTFDPNGGSLRTIDENKLTTERKTVKEGDIGQEKETTYPIKEPNDGNKQVFKVFHKQELVEPKFKPVRRGYDFMGWEIIRYKKNEQGDYTDKIDDSYRKTYKVPELYSFGNEVVSPIYLKAIWVPNNRVDVKVEHYILDKNYKLVKKLEDTLENKRAGYLVATTGDRQDDKYTLVPHDELMEKLPEDLKTIYEEYNGRVKGDNTFFQQFRVEPEKVLDDQGVLVDNPNLKNNVFKFFYRQYRQREYKVNYIDESFKGKANEKDGAIIAQELVSNGNRHFDARNYRVIPGWVLTSAPQQQLFFDVNEDTNEFLGINGTKSDEITFYYKDVRVIEVPKDGKTPDGYVRVTFKAADGGSFGTKANGDPIKELYYDVIKGLKSDLLPVPKELKEGETADANKYYITPDAGRRFSEWDKQKLLNDNTIIDREYTFTANFVWSDVKIDALVVTESFKDSDNNWINNFVPSTEALKKQIHWFKNGKEQALPDGSEVIFDANIENTLYKELKEFNNNDTKELIRTINVPAKIKFADNSIQDIKIPVKIYKNVYEGLTSEAEQKLLNDALKDPDGELFKITGPYVKVTVNPTGEPQNKDSKVYYVNKNAWVNIPEIDITDADKEILGSTYWSANDTAQNNENGAFDFDKRHKFTKDTVITLGKNDDVIEQKGKDKPNVPENYVKVTVDTTELSSDNTYFVRTFWVNPEKEVWLAVNTPAGTSKIEDGIFREFKFSGWETTIPADGKTYSNTIVNRFTKETYIKATYKYDENVKPLGKDNEWIPQGSDPSPKDFIENLYDDNDPNNPDNLPPGTRFEFVPGAEADTQTPGTDKETKIKVIYPNGEEEEVTVRYNVTGDVVEQTDPDKKPDVPDDFVKVIVKTKEKVVKEDGTQEEVERATDKTAFVKVFWVNPKKEVTIPVIKPRGIKDDTDNRIWIFDSWRVDDAIGKEYRDEITDQFNNIETTILAKYRKDDVPTPDADYVVTDVGVLPRPEDYEKFIKGPMDIRSTTIKEEPDVSKPGRTQALIEVEYKDGTKTTVWVKVYVQERRDPQPSEPQIIYRDRIVEKEKIVEKIVKIKDNERLKELRYMQGYNGKFRPYDGLRRSEAAQILANALKADGYAYDPYYPISYTDIGDTWYTEAVRIVSQAGVFQGYSDGTFKPEGKITRAEWVATLRRFQDLKKVSGNDMGLSIGHWATEEIEAAYQAGWLDVYTSGIATFDANAPITRQEVAAVSNKAFDRVLDKVYLQRNVKNMINYKDINPSMPLYEDILCASNTLLTDGKYYKANTIILDNLTFNIVTDDLLIYQKKFQYISR